MRSWRGSTRSTSLRKNLARLAVRSIREKRPITPYHCRPATVSSTWTNRSSDARHVSGIFFPQRIPLAIDGGTSSPAVLGKKVVAAAHVSSFSIGSLLLKKLGDVQITGRGLNKTATRIGTEMVLQGKADLAAYFSQPLPREHTKPTMPISLACVSVDGGRMQTRTEALGLGVHEPHWRETKNALFLRMKSDVFAYDPHPVLPACFADRKQMKSLVAGVFEVPTDAGEKTSAAPQEVATQPTADDSWRPERLFRTCLSSLSDSDTFGRMMEVEADARGFYHAQKKAFVSDGLAYNWTIQQRHFRDFTPILDFVHAVERLYEAARCLHDNVDQRWDDYLRWAQACWSGEIEQVLVELQARQSELGLPPKDCEKTDPRKIFAAAIVYFQNNASRMNYPAYRRDGLPTTSALMESYVKELNARVKGTEKFWNDGISGEAILQLRAAALCDDDRLFTFLRNRPGHPFHPNVPASQPPTRLAA